ncbi:MAG: DNA-directed RNA polymerase subunit beta [Chloroflexi bacterium]|nr:DNA-directed RNA polymerase subunit beta [Chloroflexota bacterium]
MQLDSFREFKDRGLGELLTELSPIEDYAGTRFRLEFADYEFGPPKYSEEECRERDITYSRPVWVQVKLTVKETGEIREQKLFLGDFPEMTPRGTFIINGAERVVVSQLVRSPGVYYTLEIDPATGRQFAYAKLIPSRGAWLEFETSNRDVIHVKVDGRRKITVTTLLRAIGYGSDDQVLELFAGVDTNPDHGYIHSTMQREGNIHSQQDAALDMYKRLRPGDPLNLDNAQALIHSLFFNPRRYDLGRVGRYKLNGRLQYPLSPRDRETLAKLQLPKEVRPQVTAALERMEAMSRSRQAPAEHVEALLATEKMLAELPAAGKVVEEARALLGKAVLGARAMGTRVLTPFDLVAIVQRQVQVNNGEEQRDDIDHLGNRRIRAVGELIQNHVRVGLLRMERMIKERMTIMDTTVATPASLVNVRPVVAALREFFGGSQLSQFMDQTNPLAELTHKRRLSALGPGGLSRERAGFDVRDVHHSHYGRICPIETPEGPNIGLLGSLATFGKVNEYGFIQTPYRKVVTELPAKSPELVGRTLRDAVTDKQGNVLYPAGTEVTEEVARALARLPIKGVAVRPFVTNEVRYMQADEDEKLTIAQANARLNSNGEFLGDRVEVRKGESFFVTSPEKVDRMDVSPKQIVSVSTALIPFLEHDDANRALMGSNMQRQAVPLVRPESPVVGTGMELRAALDSGQVVLYGKAACQTCRSADGELCRATGEGEVVCASGHRIIVRDGEGTEHVYPLLKYVRTNQGTCINQRPVVTAGDRVQPGDVLADSSSTDRGELALGQNVLVAFMSWEGYNFEDAIVINETLVRDDKFSSIHVEKYEVEARDTKLGPEEITRDIPNVGEESLKDLDEGGIIRIGAEVGPGDIMVGKITPKGESELTPEERLLRAIFGEKARDVKDTSLRVPHGERGTIIDVKEFVRKKSLDMSGQVIEHPDLPAGVNKLVRVWVAHKRKLSTGDKMAGRHGNKGVISRILPPEDMPYLPDGTPVDVILNPIGVPSRMNVGQVLETHLGWAAKNMGFTVVTPVFDGADRDDIEDALARAWILQQAGAISPGPKRERRPPDVAKGIEWLDQRGFDGRQVFNDDFPGEASRVSRRLWLERHAVSVQGLSEDQLRAEAEKLYHEKRLAPPTYGQTILRDGRTGEPFDQPVTVGYHYLMKLIHLVEDKIHARSTGPYSLITQQPLGGKAQFGGQRFGEMEVWALEAYSAAYNLQEFLTVKSDDVTGRAKTYEAIIKGQDPPAPGIPESFKVLRRELQSLGLSVEMLTDEEPWTPLPEEGEKEPALDADKLLR